MTQDPRADPDEDGRPVTSDPAAPDPGEAGPPGGPRPVVERLGMAVIALFLAVLFGGIALAFFVGGEIFLAAMAAVGCLMTLWVGALTLVRG
jgi:hypothetical protein